MSDQENDDVDYGPLTKRQAENIADLAARRAQERLYAEVGRSVVTKALYIIGAGCIALATYLNGWISVGGGHAK